MGGLDLDVDRRHVSCGHHTWLLTRAQMVTVHVYAVRRGHPTYPKSTWVNALRSGNRCRRW
jgi:hypothetical protein